MALRARQRVGEFIDLAETRGFRAAEPVFKNAIGGRRVRLFPDLL